MPQRTTTPLTHFGAKLATRMGIRFLAGLVLLPVVASLMQDGAFMTHNGRVWGLTGMSRDDLRSVSIRYEDIVLSDFRDGTLSISNDALYSILLVGNIDRAGNALRLAMWAVALVLVIPLIVPGRARMWAWCVIVAAASLLAAGAWFEHAVSAYVDWTIVNPANRGLPPTITTFVGAALCLVAALGAVAVLRHLRVSARRDAGLSAF